MRGEGLAANNARGEAGFAMPALLAMLAIMTVALLLAMPSWRYLVRDDKEQELIVRGRQIFRNPTITKSEKIAAMMSTRPVSW